MEGAVGDVLVREVADEALAGVERRARAKGRTLEQEVRDLIERHANPALVPFTPQERVGLSRSFLSAQRQVSPSLSLDDIRDGLE